MPSSKAKRFDYRTPRALYDMLVAAMGGDFAVDAAADETNHLTDRWFGPGGVAEDALSVPEWPSPAFCNPPYSRDIGEWCKKFYEQAQLGCDIVALLPAKIETDWWYRWVVEVGADVLFLVGRVPFEKPDDVGPDQKWYPPMFPSAVVSYSPMMSGRVAWFDWRERGRSNRKRTDADDTAEPASDNPPLYDPATGLGEGDGEESFGSDAGAPGSDLGGGLSGDQA